jgi:hypothetical protein
MSEKRFGPKDSCDSFCLKGRGYFFQWIVTISAKSSIPMIANDRPIKIMKDRPSHVGIFKGRELDPLW